MLLSFIFAEFVKTYNIITLMDWYGTPKFWLCIQKCEGSDIYCQLPQLLYYLPASDELFFLCMENRISNNFKRHLLIQSCLRLTRILKMDVLQYLFITY